MVPGSTLMYGSSFMMVTRMPRASSRAPMAAEERPLPSDESTPPVTKMNFFRMPSPEIVPTRAGDRLRSLP
jgi:hypothetical protein